MGLLNSDVAVRTVTTRIWPSDLGWTAVTRANGHLDGGNRSSRINTREPIDSRLEDCCHLFGIWKNSYLRWRYSVDQRCQNRSSMWRRSCHRDNRVIGVSANDGSGMTISDSPTRKCAGVNAVMSARSSERERKVDVNLKRPRSAQGAYWTLHTSARNRRGRIEGEI